MTGPVPRADGAAARAQELAQWRRARRTWGAVGLVAGSVLMVGGGLYAGLQQYPDAAGDPMTGIWVGSVGTLALVVGAVLLRAAYTGPYPPHLREEEQ